MTTEKAEDRHFKFQYKGIILDPYRIFRIYGITDPEQQHAIKKLLRAGKSVKTLKQDIKEVIMTLNRWVEILEEDEKEACWVNPTLQYGITQEHFMKEYEGTWAVGTEDGKDAFGCPVDSSFPVDKGCIPKQPLGSPLEFPNEPVKISGHTQLRGHY